MRRAVEVGVLLLVAAAIVFVLSVWLPEIASGDPIDSGSTTAPAGQTTPPPTASPITFAGRSARYWHAAYVSQLRRVRALKRTMLHRSSVAEALNLACATYGNCATLWRRARCETGGTFSPRAANKHSSARGLLQFLTLGRARRYGDGAIVDGGTWATTPFWRFDVYWPYANALAAGWMLRHGRGGEWACR